MLKTLTAINLDDLAAAFGWQDSPVLRRILAAIFGGMARKFARQMVDFDGRVGAAGLVEGTLRTLPGYVRSLRIYGGELLPASGPAMFLSNHPGMADTLCLFASIGRPDLKIIGLRRPFLQALPAMSGHLFYLDDDPAQRMGAVRMAAAHLRAGGAVLTFPAGEIEPDPDVYPGALESLANWTDSTGVFARFVPDLQIVPVLVRGVLWDRAVRHPLTRLKPAGADRERLGAAFQLMMHILFDLKPVDVRVQFARPIGPGAVGSLDTAAIQGAVLGRMRGLLQGLPAGPGVEIL
jgi:hypothetical protein